MNERHMPSTAACINKYIGTSYDIIKKVAENLEYLKELADVSDLNIVLNEVKESLALVDSTLENIDTILGNKQTALQSGVNIKTINGQSILGPGNVVVQPPSEVSASEFNNTVTGIMQLKFMGI